jgi:hypothetical protein
LNKSDIMATKNCNHDHCECGCSAELGCKCHWENGRCDICMAEDRSE